MQKLKMPERMATWRIGVSHDMPRTTHGRRPVRIRATENRTPKRGSQYY
jgi:hypothetical protein